MRKPWLTELLSGALAALSAMGCGNSSVATAPEAASDGASRSDDASMDNDGSRNYDASIDDGGSPNNDASRSDAPSQSDDSGPTEDGGALGAESGAQEASSPGGGSDASVGNDASGPPSCAFDADTSPVVDAGTALDCREGGRCVAPFVMNGEWLLVADSTYLYFTHLMDGAMRVPLAGGTPALVAAGMEVGGIAGANLFGWIGEPGGTPESPIASLVVVPVTGGTPQVLASAISLPRLGWDEIAVDGANVYWISGEEVPSADGGRAEDWQVNQVSLDGGVPKTLASGRSSSEFGAVGEIATDGQNVFWLLDDPDEGGPQVGNVMSVPVQGGAAVALASRPQRVLAGLAVDAGTIYWAEESNDPCIPSAVVSLPTSGGVPNVLATGRHGVAGHSVTLDDGNVYWAWADPPTAIFRSCTVMTVPRAGGEATTLVSGEDGLQDLTAIGNALYWVETSGSGTMRLTPK
jgi:hypothetical protein